jgi:mRNA interferase HigB
MRIIRTSIIEECYQKHADAKTPLEWWVSIMRNLDLSSLNDIKNYFGSADVIGRNRVVFNIKGNRYRLITVVLIRNQTIYVRWAGTHAEYDKIAALTV